MAGNFIPELVLVEGIMGAGKSGVAQAIARMILSTGATCRWFFEHETPHPVGRDDDPTLPKDYNIARSRIQWRRFVRDWKAPPTAVIDGRLLNINITHAIMSGLSTDNIIDSLSETMAPLQARQSLPIHLFRRDLRTHLRRILETRHDRKWYIGLVKSSPFAKGSSKSGFDLAVQLLECAQSTSIELARRFPGDVQRIDVERTPWDEIVERVGGRLGTKTIDRDFRSNRVPAIEGTYVLRYESRDIEITIRKAGDSLVLAGHPWSLLGGADHEFTLLPEGDGTLMVRSAPIRFIPREREGRVVELLQRGWFSEWGSLREPLVRTGP